MADTLNILAIGDIVGSPGREILERKVPELTERYSADFIIANGENASGGRYITPENAIEILSYGVDLITTGNHIWQNKKILEILDIEPRIVRPANYPDGVPGNGYYIRKVNDIFVCTINLIGRINLVTVDCPFKKFDEIYDHLKNQVDIIIVDFHAETTSEKRAFGWYADGRASCVFGTHTHVQTADEEILPRGTGYITDIGMTGPFNSVIGMDKEKSIQNFLSRTNIRFDVASGDVRLNGIVLMVDREGRTINITRIAE
jgi:metallophosphoesterase (TIGR00282 family)